MTGFAQRAQELLEAALNAPVASEMTILICADGSLRLCADSDWPLDSLARERGAQAAYRVSTRGSSVRVEGRQGQSTCILESQRSSLRTLLPRT